MSETAAHHEALLRIVAIKEAVHLGQERRFILRQVVRPGAVADVVGKGGGVVSGLFNEP